MKRLGSTGRAAATYISLAALQRGISLLILPFVTHVMPPDEYGAASTLSAASVLVTVVIAAPLVQLIIRAAARGEDDGPALLRAAGLYCYLVVPVVVSLIALALFVLAHEVVGIPGRIWALELLAIGFQPATFTFAMWVARAREDLRRFVWLSSTSVAATAIGKIVFVVVFRLGVLGWVISDLLAAVVSAILAMSLVRLPRSRPTSHHVRYALRFTLPLIPHSASLWALNSLSRPVMAAVSPLEQVGLLSFGLNLASVAGLILAESNAALLPRYARETFQAPTHETSDAVKWQLIGAFVVPSVVACGVAVAGRWMFASTYWPSFSLVGVLLIAQVAYGLYLIPMNYLTQTAGLPKYSALASGAGATVIVLSILTLAPHHGAAGVAYGSTAGYVAMAAIAFVLTRVQGLDISWGRWLELWPEIGLAAMALMCGVGALVSPVGSSYPWTLAGISVALSLISVAAIARRRAS